MPYNMPFLAENVQSGAVWNELPSIITNLSENGHPWNGNGICQLESSTLKIRTEKKIPSTKPLENTNNNKIQGADFETVCL